MWGSKDKPLFGHPEIVIHFGEIFIAGIWNERDDAFRFLLLPAITQCTGEQRSSG